MSLLRRNLVLFLIFVFFCTMQTCAFAFLKNQINFYEAYQLALANNPKMGISNSSIDEANAKIIQSKGMQWPQISFEFNGTRSDNPLNVFGYRLSQGNVSFADFGAQQFTGPGSLNVKPNALNHPGYYNNFYTAFKLEMPIYTGGRIQANRAKANEMLFSAQQLVCFTKNQLAYDILQAYEGVLTTIELQKIAKENLKYAKSYLVITQNLFSQAITLESDILLAKSYVNAGLLALHEVEMQRKNQLEQFRLVIGCPDSKLEPSAPINFYKDPRDNLSMVDTALRSNSQLKVAESKIKAQKADILISKSYYRPQINLKVRQMWNGPTLGSGLPSNIITLGLDWKLFSVGEQKGAVQLATAEAKKAAFSMHEERNNLKTLLIQTINTEEQAQQSFETNKSIIREGNSIVEIVRERFGRGLVPLSALLDSQMKLTQAKAQQAQALYAKKMARARVLMIMNQLAPNSLSEK